MTLKLEDPLGLASASDAEQIRANNRKLEILANGADPFPQYLLESVLSGTVLPSNPVAGQPFLLRAGSTPFEFIALVYDATYGKWVSAPQQAMTTETGKTTTSTTYTGTFLGGQFAWVFNGDALVTAGLTLQLAIGGLLSNSGANSTSLSGRVFAVDDGDTSATAIFAGGAPSEVSNTGTTATYKTSGWVQPTLDATAKTHYLLDLGGKVSAGTGTFSQCSLAFRWVSA
jgi:hypothetical protein